MINGCGIYQITNIVTGDYYLGSAVNIRKRMCKHRWQLTNNTHGNEHLQRAWNKYGEEAFEFTVLLLCDPENKLYYEQTLIDGLNPAYNIAKNAAASMQGLQHSEATKHKIGTANKGKCHTEESRHNMSLAHVGKTNGRLGKHLSDETKRKISEGNKGKFVSEETRAKSSEAQKGELHWNFGKHRSAETKHKLSEVNKDKHPSEETRSKMSEVHKGKHHTDEARANMRGRVVTNETRAKISEAHKGKPNGRLGYKHTEATSAKISESMKRYWATKCAVENATNQNKVTK